VGKIGMGLLRSEGALVCVLALSSACSRTPAEETLGTSADAILTTYRVRLPNNVALGAFAAAAEGTLTVGDRAQVVDTAGVPALVSNAGTGKVTLNTSAQTGSIVSVGAVELKKDSKVTGDVTTQGTITITNATVTGTQSPATNVGPLHDETFAVDFTTNTQGSITLNSPPTGERVTNLAPGRYSSVTIQPRNRVNLRSGDYVLNSFDLEPQSRLVIDDTNGPVRISVRDTVLYKGHIQSAGSSHPAVRFVDVGTSLVVLESAFTGTFLAPNASVRLATLPAGESHIGAFYGKSLELSPDVKLVSNPYLTYGVTSSWQVPNPGGVQFGPFVARTDGSVLATTESGAVSISSTGTVTTLLTGTQRRKFVLHPDGSAFGEYSEQNFLEYAADGSSLGTIPMTVPGSATFIPGSSNLAFVYSDQQHEGRLAGISIASTSGVTATIPDAGGVDAVRTSPQGIVYNTLTELVKTTSAGVELWRKPIALRQLAASANGKLLVGLLDQPGSTVVHVSLADGSIVSTLTLGAPAYDIVAANSGEYTLAGTKQEVFVFRNGLLDRRVPVPARYFATADVNDQGEVVVGGIANDGRAVIFLNGRSGSLSSTTTLTTETHAYRPWVRFYPNGSNFGAVTNSALVSYAVTRKL